MSQQQTEQTSRTGKITIKPRRNQVDTWLHLLRLFMEKRGSDADRFGKAVPRTTNSDVKQLANYWHSAVIRSQLARYFKTDNDPSSRTRWVEAYTKINAQLSGADPAATYAENEWFWKEASYRAASYLDALAFVPSHFELITESVTETLKEHKDRIKDAIDKSGDLLSMVKKGVLILAGVVGGAIVIPPVIRAFRDSDRRRD